MTNKKCILLCLLLSFFSIHIYSQNGTFDSNEKLSSFLLENPAEKLYVHTDREIFTEKDTIWYKIYLSDAHLNVPVQGLNNVYVELISASGEMVSRNLIAVVNGFGNGDLSLQTFNLSEGDYLFRAYSQYQMNFGDNFIFSKTLRIKEIPIDPFYGTIESEEHLKSIDKMVEPFIDIQFLPEGGTFVEGISNILAYKAVDSSGKPKDFTGRIVDEQGNIISLISSVHEGMGKVDITPEKGRPLKAIIDGYKNLEIPLPEISGYIQLSAFPSNHGFCNVLLQTKQNFQKPIKYYVVCTSNGLVNSALEVNVKSRVTKMNIFYSEFTQGINQITLTDSLYRPLAERLVFINKNDSLVMEISTTKKEYFKRENVDVNLSVLDNSKPVFANLSVSVVNKAQVSSIEKYPQNIVSYLLLDSELKGNIDNPSFYFKDDSPATYMKLDLVMLTHGWRKYTWNNLASEMPSINYEREEGIVIKGKVKRLLSKKGAEDGKVTILVKESENYPLILETTTNDSGYFRFPPSLFLDSSNVFVQGLNKRNKKNTEIVNLTTFAPPAPIRTNVAKLVAEDIESEEELSRMAYVRLMDDKAYHPEKYVIMLDEVTVTENKISEEEQDDGHSRIYGMADNVVKVDETNNHYSSFLELLYGIPGVQVNGNSVIIRGSVTFGGSSEPHYVLDGMPVGFETLRSIPVSEIDKVEILKSIGNTAMYGMRGANGVILVFTKRGEISYADPYVTGILTDKIRGYYKSRDFYSPNYEEIEEGMPDHRATIYWNPFVVADSTGTANFSFYTSDDAAPALIRVEGITNNGKPVVGFVEINMTGEE